MVKRSRWRKASDPGRYSAVEQRLSAALVGVDPDAPAPVKTAALGAALCELGPAFRLFGLYLSQRLDLLPEPACQILAAIPEECAPLAPRESRAQVEATLGRPLEEVFHHFAEPPHRSTLYHQEHRALLAEGEAVLVRLSRDDLVAAVEKEGESLPLVVAALAPKIEVVRCRAAVDDLLATLKAAADPAPLIAGLGSWGDGSSPRSLIPTFVPDSCGPGLVTRHALAGSTLTTRVRTDGDPDLARRLCRRWLAQALFGGPYPTVFGGDDVVLSGEGKIGWVGGLFEALPASSRPRLWKYLQAAAAQDPDAAASALLLDLTGGPADEGRALVQLLRQGIPFRDAGLGAHDDLAGYLFLHWRLTAQLGYLPRPHLLAFWRGLAIVARQARALAPGHDGLRAAIDRLRLTSRVGEVVDSFAPGEMQPLATEALVALLDMPGKLDRALTLAAEGKLTVTLQSTPTQRDESRRRDGSQAVMAALLAIAAVVLAARYLQESGLGGAWLEPVATAVVLLLALFLLRQLSWLWRVRR